MTENNELNYMQRRGQNILLGAVARVTADFAP